LHVQLKVVTAAALLVVAAIDVLLALYWMGGLSLLPMHQ
jgi:hypothetical protein